MITFPLKKIKLKLQLNYYANFNSKRIERRLFVLMFLLSFALPMFFCRFSTFISHSALSVHDLSILFLKSPYNAAYSAIYAYRAKKLSESCFRDWVFQVDICFGARTLVSSVLRFLVIFFSGAERGCAVCTASTKVFVNETVMFAQMCIYFLGHVSMYRLRTIKTAKEGTTLDQSYISVWSKQ